MVPFLVTRESVPIAAILWHKSKSLVQKETTCYRLNTEMFSLLRIINKKYSLFI